MTFIRKPKKYTVQVAGNPAFAQGKKKNDAILNPHTGTPSFGTFPAICRQEVEFQAGAIYLRYGEHNGPKSGWGLEHIWKSRFPKIGVYSDAEVAVTNLVSSILVAGAKIHYENELGIRGRRTSVFRGQQGVVVVEARVDGKGAAFYSIITAFRTGQVHGYVIGNL
jgi:hypothetical protein